jgi:hypothetical protein
VQYQQIGRIVKFPVATKASYLLAKTDK